MIHTYKNWTEEQVNDLVKSYQSGVTVWELAKKYNRPFFAIGAVLSLEKVYIPVTIPLK